MRVPARTITKEEFDAFWREECREWFEIYRTLANRYRGNRDGQANTATTLQRRKHPLLLDLLDERKLVVVGWKGKRTRGG